LKKRTHIMSASACGIAFTANDGIANHLRNGIASPIGASRSGKGPGSIGGKPTGCAGIAAGRTGTP
jgi:hypothetical protein